MPVPVSQAPTEPTRSVPARVAPPTFETLEARLLLSVDGVASAYDQYMLELINRARANPAAEAARHGINLNEGISDPQLLISPDPKQPLAFHVALEMASEYHCEWLLTYNMLSSVGVNGTYPRDRAMAYEFPTQWVTENYTWRGSPAPIAIEDLAWWTDICHSDLILDSGDATRAHRRNIMEPAHQRIGIGIRIGPFTYGGYTYSAVMVVQDFGWTGEGPLLTGVAYNDGLVLDDDFYTPGEELAGITITAVRTSDGQEFSTATAPAGGYAIELAAGAYEVYATNPVGVSLYLGPVTMTNANVKLDAVSDFQPPQEQAWTGAADEAWANAANWSEALTTGAATTAIFAAAATHQPVLGGNTVLAGVTFNTAGWTLGGAAYTLSVGAVGVDSLGAGTNTVAPRVALLVDATSTVGAGNSLEMTGGLTGGGCVLTKAGPGTLGLADAAGLSGLTINAGLCRLAGAGDDALVTGALAITAGGAALDLGQGNLVVNYPAAGPSPFDAVEGWLRTGQNGGPTGYWDGPGIRSSSAATDPTGLTTLGVIDNADYGWTDLEGVPVDASSVLVKHTYYGDADLDGAPTGDDYFLWLAGFDEARRALAAGETPTLSGWLYGDFDYSGDITSDDYFLWLVAFDAARGGAAPLGTGDVRPLAGEVEALRALAAPGVVVAVDGWPGRDVAPALPLEALVPAALAVADAVAPLQVLVAGPSAAAPAYVPAGNPQGTDADMTASDEVFVDVLAAVAEPIALVI